MTQPVYDARSPRVGVRVMPVPISWRRHLPQVAAKATRVLQTHHNGELVGVLCPHFIGGAVILGRYAVGRELQRACPIRPTRSTIPGHRRRGHLCHPGNMAFAATIPTPAQYGTCLSLAKAQRAAIARRRRNIAAQIDLRLLRRMHAALLRTRGVITQGYRDYRRNCLQLFPWIQAELSRVEKAQRQSLQAA